MQEKKINVNGEVITKRKTSFSTISRKNVSVQPVGSSKVVVYDFVNTYEPGPSGTKEDYRVLKKPKKIDEYDIEKVMFERCKGQDLKSIVSRIEKTGDLSILNQRNPVYGDGRVIPSTLADALDKGVKTDNFLSKFSNADIEKMIVMSKDPKKFEEFISQEVSRRQSKENKVPVQQQVNVEEKKGDQ